MRYSKSSDQLHASIKTVRMLDGSNLSAMCNAYIPDRHHIEIVDIFRDPDRALGDGIFMTPTLVKLGPLPSRRIVGTLSQTQPVLQALGLEALPS